MGTVVGITVVDYLPVGIVHLPVCSGLNVIYGKNGVGKTRLLAAVRRLLFSSGPSESWLGDPSSCIRALYGAGGFHLEVRVNDESARSDPAWSLLNWVIKEPTLTDAVFDMDEHDAASLMAEDWTQSAVDRIVAGATWPDPTEDEARSLVEDGRWMISPSKRGLEVFAASNPSRTLAPRWLDTGENDLPLKDHDVNAVLPRRNIEDSG